MYLQNNIVTYSRRRYQSRILSCNANGVFDLCKTKTMIVVMGFRTLVNTENLRELTTRSYRRAGRVGVDSFPSS